MDAVNILRSLLLAGTAAMLWLPLHALAEQPPGAPTIAKSATAPRDGQHDFDFAFGAWKTHISRLLHPLTDSTTWVEYDGTHVIRKIWGGKANLGELEVDGPAGHIEAMSPRLYNPETHQWSISYGNPREGSLSRPVVGEFKDGRGEFYGQDTVNGRAILVREIYTPVSPTSRRLEIAYSDDGGKTWETNWKMTDTKIGDDVANAIGDPARPADELAQDLDRKPTEVVNFAGIKPGMVVVDLMPGSGYYTRILSKLVGPQGKVYALQPIEMDKAAPKGLKSLQSFAGAADYPNVTVLLQPVAALSVPEHVDLVWTSMNYHDLHDSFLGSPDMAKFNRSILDTLKPGGTFLVLDHAAAAGTGFSKTDSLHRVDPAAAKNEILAAGFEFAGESAALHNPDDDHTLGIYNKSLRGKTDRFIYKFQKPQH